jgi:pyridoxal phosphate enzyme (YggS family)
MLPEEEIVARFQAVQGRVEAALKRAGREPGSCRIVLASKTQPPGAIVAAYRAGAREFGENYVQEALAKRPVLGTLDGVTWHLIGHLQTNKVRAAVKYFDLIQTLDSARLAQALNRVRSRPPVRSLIEVNLGGEATKSGVAPDAVEALIDETRSLVLIEGLMTIPPILADIEENRGYFAKLCELRERLAALTGLHLSELSMGMTDDYEIAIEEGATIVRVGRAVFGER